MSSPREKIFNPTEDEHIRTWTYFVTPCWDRAHCSDTIGAEDKKIDQCLTKIIVVFDILPISNWLFQYEYGSSDTYTIIITGILVDFSKKKKKEEDNFHNKDNL